jgi:hypothetical protein
MKRIVGLGALCLALLAAPVGGSELQRGGGVHFIKISFDPPGEDGRSNKTLNKEYVTIRNDTEHNRNLKGWVIYDLGQMNTYRVTKKVTLYEGAVLTLYTGKGRDLTSICIDYCGPGPSARFSKHWDLDHEVWDNERDQATLVRRDGLIVDTCGYGRAAERTKPC